MILLYRFHVHSNLTNILDLNYIQIMYMCDFPMHRCIPDNIHVHIVSSLPECDLIRQNPVPSFWLERWLEALFWTSGPFRSKSMKRPWWWVRSSFLNASAIKAWVGARCKASRCLMVKKSRMMEPQMKKLQLFLKRTYNSSISHFEHHRKHQQWGGFSSSKIIFKIRRKPTTGAAIPGRPQGGWA